MEIDALKKLLLSGDPFFWKSLVSQTFSTKEFHEILYLSTLRKRAHSKLPNANLPSEKIKIAIIGGCSFYPLHELLEHFLECYGYKIDLWLGNFDNYISETTEESSPLYSFNPKIVLVMPSFLRGGCSIKLSDPVDSTKRSAQEIVCQLLSLAQILHQRSKAEVIMTNFLLPSTFDPGPYRCRTLGSDWNFWKWVNMEFGLNAPYYLHICDVEFLSYKYGGDTAFDPKAWFESKQPFSLQFLPHVSLEIAHIVKSLNTPPKKVLVLDLDNTIWGGVVADDGIDGIEIGDTSPLGEAFKSFQRYILTLKDRGILLAVCSKNDHEKACEVFDKHPEMILKKSDFCSFKANWEPKSENIRKISTELNLGLDSFVFADDNPAEIEIIRQFLPEVHPIHLGPDPANYIQQLKDSRFFEPLNITHEDLERTSQYQSEAKRTELFSSITDMDSYWASLGMEASFRSFTPIDIPRVAQLINKSNQFNLTTKRRTESDIQTLAEDPSYLCFSVRLKDRFGDHGLISVVILELGEKNVKIDTWLMSCRVLKRQVEHEVLNEIVCLAQRHNKPSIVGTFLPTAKNNLVKKLYPEMGFSMTSENEDSQTFTLLTKTHSPFFTKIHVIHHSYDP